MTGSRKPADGGPDAATATLAMVRAVPESASTSNSEATGAQALPGVWRLGMARGGIEVKAFFRDKMAVEFIFGLPSILLGRPGSIFGGQAAAHGVTVGQRFTAGMIAGGIMSTSFQYLAIGISTE